MLYALINNIKTKPTETGERANCPFTGAEMISKCGTIKSHHWAYKNAAEGIEYKGETDWHLQWKSMFNSDFCEIMHKDKFGNIHIADYDDGNIVMEFQHSAINVQEVLQRELFYISLGRKFIWVLDGKTYLNDASVTSSKIVKLTVKYLSTIQRDSILRSKNILRPKWTYITDNSSGKKEFINYITYTLLDEEGFNCDLLNILKPYQLESLNFEILKEWDKKLQLESRKKIYNISRSPIFIDLQHLKEGLVYSVLQKKTINVKDILNKENIVNEINDNLSVKIILK